MLQSNMADDTKMFLREVDELLNVIGFVEIDVDVDVERKQAQAIAFLPDSITQRDW